ncbi:MAG TPA: hypothetical protein VH300_00025 [Thermoleophilaceae bacterium]|nr:hypothetical protein [Thermoleophilaceae bacterium]
MSRLALHGSSGLSSESFLFSEGLSDNGELTGRGSPILRGAITGGGTLLVVVAVELLLLGWLRHTFFSTSFVRSFVSVTVRGALT